MIVADTHVHIYPCYDLPLFFKNAFRNFSALEQKAFHVLMLTERFDCHFFEDLCNKAVVCSGYSFIPVDDLTVRVDNSEGKSLYVVAGRQIVSLERIEILGLMLNDIIPDGLPIKEALTRIQNLGGLAILSWAPGKWFFKRGATIHELIMLNAYKLMLGDTSLRPTLWKTPRLMRYGQNQGLKLLAGSDPLPFKGEEHLVGNYGIVSDGSFDEKNPALSIKTMLNNGHWKIVGDRCSFFEVLCRLIKNYRSKKG